MGILNALIVLRRCLLRSAIKTYLKSKLKYDSSSLMSIEFDSKLVSDGNDNYLKIKTKLCEDKVNTNFQGKKTPKENAL